MLSLIGRAVEGGFLRVGLYSQMLGRVVVRVSPGSIHWRNLMQQAEQVGVHSLPVVLLTAMFTGMVLALQSYIAFHRFGAESMIAAVVSLSTLRELGPVLVGLMVAGRVGAAFAAELGTMRVSEQIDALWTLSVDPLRYLVVPRVLAALLMMPLLVVLADIIGVGGGYLVSVVMLDQNPMIYIEKSFAYLNPNDFHSGLIKAAFFGMIIGVIGCAEGFYCSGGAQGVGQATTRAVVASSMTILIFDYLLTAVMFQ